MVPESFLKLQGQWGEPDWPGLTSRRQAPYLLVMAFTHPLQLTGWYPLPCVPSLTWPCTQPITCTSPGP